MTIISIRWADATHCSVFVVLQDGVTVCVPWPANIWWSSVILDWLASGNTIAPEDPPPLLPDLSDIDNLERALKALGLVTATWCGKSVVQLKTDFKTAYNLLS